MKRYITSLTILFCAGKMYAGDGGGAIDLKGASVADALNIYSRASHLELAIQPAVTNQLRYINFSISAASKKDMLEAFQSALHDQAKVVITKLDDKHASVSLDKK